MKSTSDKVFWDTNVLVAAMENNCNTLYSEDLHHGQLIENKLKIVNPFLQ
jgi:predicted nucleic acid-binding protein